MNRKVATFVAAVSTWALGVLALLSFNILSDITIFTIHVNGVAKPQGIFDALDYSTSKIMLPLVGLGTIIFMGWFVNQKSIQDELGLHGIKWKIWEITTKVIAPIGIIIVFLAELGVLNMLGFNL